MISTVKKAKRCNNRFGEIEFKSNSVKLSHTHTTYTDQVKHWCILRTTTNPQCNMCYVSLKIKIICYEYIK